ncbi:hypothetical protein CALCODRAFT_513395 [Calocera cornea HHB12733]|uniref:Uncharacterized protein n=1 Tax=Calocera cornea HHB12733 TaxID=1353952 RepID=A0A165C5L7_9BASI|nr:hypothetical protein CALCODRAFT_513395 [Calocera cornea HHB12733]
MPSPYGVAGTGLMSFYGGLTAWAIYVITCAQGVFFVLFCFSIHVMCFRQRRGRINRLLLGASVVIFVLTTVDIIITSNSLVIGLFFVDNGEGGIYRDEYFGGGKGWTYVFQDTAVILNVLVADLVLLYRAWIVWGKRSWVVAFNALIWLATIACSIRVLQLQALAISNPAWSATLLELNNWSITTLAMSLAQNVIATGLIAVRLWTIDRRAAAYKTGSFGPLIRLLVESGTIYTSLLLVDIISEVTYDWSELLVSSLVCPIIGVTFSLITVRVGLGLTERAETGGTGITNMSGTISTKPTSFNVRRSIIVDRSEGRSTVNLEDGAESFQMKGPGVGELPE